MSFDLQNKKVLVIGTGISGIGAAGLLQNAGANVILYEGRETAGVEEIESKLPPGLAPEIRIGVPPDPVKEDIVLVVPSPGVPVTAPIIKSFYQAKIPVWGEMELAYRFARGRLAAITGTNGKTTTTALVGEILKSHYASVFVVGNIGFPYTEAAPLTGENSVTVAEISSFQLETIEDFHPEVSAVLNLTPDHLDRHGTMEEYARVKGKIAENQTKENYCVLNYDNQYTRELGECCPASIIWFSSQKRLNEGIYLEDEAICLSDQQGRRRLMGIHEMNLVGLCNVENVMAAIAITMSLKVPMDLILNTIKTFRAVEHRIEYVATKGGVWYYNDSKGTNPDAAIQGIKAMSRPTVLLAGGYDKQSEYDEWILSFDHKVKCLVLIGQTADKIEACARKHGITAIERADSYEEALRICTERASDGDAVLLSPACASWGMFPNYEVRGNLFKDYVNSLKE